MGSSGCLTFFLVVTAIGGSIMGLLGLLVGFGMIAAPRAPSDQGTGVFVLIASLILCVLPATLSIWGLAYTSGRKKRLNRLVSLAGTHAKLTMTEIGQELGMDAASARKLVLEAVELRLVQGRLDIEEGAFFPENVAQPEVAHHTAPCPGCGATVSATIVPGQPVSCPYCGRRLV